MFNIIKNNALLCILLASLGLNLGAEEAQNGAMVIFSDVSSAQEILNGDYTSAIHQMNAAGSENPVFLLNNLCVAYTLAGELKNAQQACSEALKQIDQRRNYGSDWFEQKAAYRIRQKHRAQALAHLELLRSLDTSNLSAEVRVDK